MRKEILTRHLDSPAPWSQTAGSLQNGEKYISGVHKPLVYGILLFVAQMDEDKFLHNNFAPLPVKDAPVMATRALDVSPLIFSDEPVTIMTRLLLLQKHHQRKRAKLALSVLQTSPFRSLPPSV